TQFERSRRRLPEKRLHLRHELGWEVTTLAGNDYAFGIGNEKAWLGEDDPVGCILRYASRPLEASKLLERDLGDGQPNVLVGKECLKRDSICVGREDQKAYTTVIQCVEQVVHRA